MLYRIKNSIYDYFNGLKYLPKNDESKNTESKSLAEELKEVFLYWVTATTAHGFYNVLTARYLASKIAWISLMIISILLCYNGKKFF